ncbi:MAG: carboxypeptidase regulatory-like domain-containing protein [Terracidiphilus sp.]|jgi:hypothetical protein
MMQVVQQVAQSIFKARRTGWGAAVLAMFLLLVAPAAFAQIITGNLSGTVRDGTGAVVPNASVTLTNEATGDSRETVDNGSGYFTFAAVQAGSYTVVIKTTGFATWQQTGIVMNAGDVREVAGIALKVGAASQTVTVLASPAQMVPTDTGVRSDVISSKDLQTLSLESRNVSELLKVLPGVTYVPNGTNGGGSVDFSAESPTGSTDGVGYSPSGSPYRGGTSYLLDGANIIDPGCNCYSIAVPNPDMTEEVKVQQSFGADAPNGPVVINTTSKSGGKQFHGQGYFYARNQALNSNTWLNNNSKSPKQPGQYYYPGGNIGGPILIPHTTFQKAGKLFFWAGYEYYKQTLPASAPLESYIPSAGMMAGNFTLSGSGNSALCPSGFSSGATNWCGDPTGYLDSNGNAINAAAVPVDPGAKAIMKMFPAANANPLTTPGGFNYVLPYSSAQNGYVWRGRVDYDINENHKLFVTYQQGATTYISVAHVYYNPQYNVAYPGGDLDQPATSRVMTVNFVSVLRPTLTNEFVFGWGWLNAPFSPTDLSAIYKTTLGYPYQTVYNTGSLVVPSLNVPTNAAGQAIAQTFPDISQPAFYNSAGVYPTLKAVPSFADNVTKVWRTHTFKFGGFTDLVGNEQGYYDFPNGQLSFGTQPYPNNLPTGSKLASTTEIGSTNPTANLVMGIAKSFSQNSYSPTQDQAYRTISGYLMDDWHVRPRLTVNVGMRWDHVGRWYDRQGVGLAVWMPSLYPQDVAENQAAGKMVVEYPGVRWRGIDPGIPNGGSPTRLAWATPRVGFAYDLKGDGQTVIRGGWGEYVWNDQWNDYSSQLSTSQNIMTYSSPGSTAITLSQIPLQTPTGNNEPAGNITAADYNDSADPLTYAWNLTVDRQLPWKSMLEVAYVGNSTHHLLMGGESSGTNIGGQEFTNVNKIPLGGLFGLDPVTGAKAPSDPDNTGSYTLQDYYPYGGCVASGSCYGYGTNQVYVYEHTGNANYNGLQVAWMKQSGHATWDFNYTWSKSLGMLNSTLDAFHVHGNYGILSIDRPQVFNASYSYSIGNVYKSREKLVSGLANGWTISGITTFQSGGNLQSDSSQNLGLSLQQPKPGNPSKNESLTTKTYFGTDADAILPITTCNPKSGLGSHQLLNLSCFSAPTLGTQGDRVIHPYLGGPIYTDSDLTVFKRFNVTERQNVEFRASAFDFMNHSLWGFSGNNLLTLTYQSNDGGHTFFTNSGILGVNTSAWGVMNQKSPYSGAGYARIVELSMKYNF